MKMSHSIKCIISLVLAYILMGINTTYAAKDSTSSKGSKNFKSDLAGFKKKEAKYKADLKKIEKKLSFKNFFHHVDSVEVAHRFVHEQHSKVRKGKKSPYVVDHEKLGLKVEAYKPGQTFEPKYEVFGWYPHWESDLYNSLNYSLLTTIAYFSYEVNPANGEAITTYDWETTPLIDSANQNGVKVLLTLSNFGEEKNRQLLESDDSKNTLIKNVVDLIKMRGAHGVCIDFEGVAHEQKEEYSYFINNLSEKLKKVNKEHLVYLAVPSVDWAKSLNYQVLIPAIDQFVIMGYGYYGSTSKVAGPIDGLFSGKIWEPYNLSLSVDQYLANQIPPSKLILALPFYGGIWYTTIENKGAYAKGYVGARTYDYIRSQINAPVQYDSISQTAWCSYVMDTGQTHFRQCWFDDDSTLSVKLNYIKSKNLRGMGIWALGYDKGYPDLWEAIAKNMCDTIIRPGVGVVADSNATTVDTAASGIWSQLANVESLLRQISDYKTVLMATMSFVVFYGGVGLLISMFQPNTRMFFFGSTANTIYYTSVVLLFLIVVVRWTKVFDDKVVVLILGFIAGAVALYFAKKIVDRKNNNKP